MMRWLFLAALSISAAIANAQGILVGTVTRVWDGDTITLRTLDGETEKIRLLGIDAPEKGQPNWRDSWSWLKRTINNRTVTVHWTKRDSTESQRLLGTIKVDGENFNLLMVCRGQAWYFRRYADDLTSREQASYDACERRARAERQGIWEHPDPEAPWDYRARMRSKRK